MSAQRPTLVPALCYRDPKAALKWLEAAFGFETAMVITNAEGSLEHSEMRFGDGIIMVGTEWTADHTSPASIAGKNTQTVHVHLTEDIDKHCARAKAAGAVIGAVMKAMRGQADAARVRELVLERAAQ